MHFDEETINLFHTIPRNSITNPKKYTEMRDEAEAMFEKKTRLILCYTLLYQLVINMPVLRRERTTPA